MGNDGTLSSGIHTNIQSSTSIPAVAVSSRRVRRRISPQAGMGLECSSHAIEYLADELVHDGGFLDPADSRFAAIQILINLNRKIYFECPVAPSFLERLRAAVRKGLARLEQSAKSAKDAESGIKFVDPESLQIDGPGVIGHNRTD